MNFYFLFGVYLGIFGVCGLSIVLAWDLYIKPSLLRILEEKKGCNNKCKKN